MDAEQIQAEMRATRSRIDRNLDRLQARMTDTGGRAARRVAGVAVIAAGIRLTLSVFRRLRARARRRRILRRVRAA
jgi:hypothetical protein